MALSDIRAPIHKNRQTTMGRISGLYSTGSLFSKINLSGKNYGSTQGVKEVLHYPILGPHGTWKDVSHEEIKAGPWNPVRVGQAFGPTWTTHWFHLKFDAPPAAEFMGKEVHLRFVSGTEACLYDMDFNVIQGISPGYREEYKFPNAWTGSEPLEYYVEMACNGMFGAGEGSDIAPPNPDRYFTLANIDLAVFNRENFNLLNDLETLYGISEQLNDTHIGYQAMFAANEMVTLIRENQNQKASQIAQAFFLEKTGSKAHTLYAMGHCHIDTAWLWPYDETIRKCARSFSAQLGLMNEYDGSGDNPVYKFVCSSAQQFAWVEKYYPDLFTKMVKSIEDGKFVPVGGTWVEMDGNIPNGEAFMRQYYYGQQYFKEKFKILCKEFWLPDTFGYSAQIPQMLQHVGITRFLTQKMSWSLVNKFPNHNFWWEGIDGTKVLVHFPPGDSYNMNGTVSEVLKSQNNSMDKGRANTGVYLYGFGDGGGGPTRQMIERLKRVRDVDGLPRVKFGDSNEFFEELEKESKKFYKWVGELYLELHNGTYTSQAKIKWFNRKCEFLFREVELLMAMGYSIGDVVEAKIFSDMDVVDSCWKDFLLNQFHDVLPGSCIEFVAEDAWEIYTNLFNELMRLRKEYFTAILKNTGSQSAVYNCLPWPTKTVIFSKPDTGSIDPGPNVQAVTLDSTAFDQQNEGWYRVPNQFSAALVSLEPSGFSAFSPETPLTAVSFSPSAPGSMEGTYSNGKITLEVKIMDGIPVEELFFDGENKIPAFNDYLDKKIVPGMFYIYDDVPLFWDAWDVMDYHLETHRLPDYEEIQQFPSFGTGPIVGGYKWSAKFGKKRSSITRYTIMRAESPMIEYYTIVDWHEDHKMLKVEWPVDVLSRDATFEIQYGHASRPTHINTSWDMAKFEVCGHKWMDISQADKGVTIITDSKYGWHTRENIVALSLLKSPKNPDANCDMGKHFIYYAVLPHKGTFQNDDIIQRAYELNTLGSNNVSVIRNAAMLPANFVTCNNKAVIVEAVKVSGPVDDQGNRRSNTLCVRLYESHGGYAKNTEITIDGFPATEVFHSNGLEDEIEKIQNFANNKFSVDFKPFQIQSFLVKFSP